MLLTLYWQSKLNCNHDTQGCAAVDFISACNRHTKPSFYLSCYSKRNSINEVICSINQNCSLQQRLNPARRRQIMLWISEFHALPFTERAANSHANSHIRKGWDMAPECLSSSSSADRPLSATPLLPPRQEFSSGSASGHRNVWCWRDYSSGKCVEGPTLRETHTLTHTGHQFSSTRDTVCMF